MIPPSLRILAMPPGPDVDRLVWLHVLGGSRHQVDDIGWFQPSKDLVQATELTGRVGRQFVLSRGDGISGWRAEFRRASGRWIDAEAATPALAICRAALLVTMEAA